MGVSTGATGTVYMGYADTPTTFTNQAMTKADAGAKAYITDPTMRAWDPDTPVTLTYTGGTYTGTAIVCAGGIVRFNPALGAGVTVTASGKYIPVSAVRTCLSISMDVEVTEEDSTTIPITDDADAGWAKNTPVSRNISGTLEMLQDDTYGNLGRTAVIGDPENNEDPGKVLFVEWGITGSFTQYLLVWPGLSVAANANALNKETINFTNCGVPPGLI